MKVNFTGYNIYKSKTLKKGLEFVSDNGALFAAGTSLALATVVRPLSILAAPKTDKENKKLAAAKSIASSAVGFCLMLGVTLPISGSIKKINNAPEKYLKKSTINNLKEGVKPLTSSKAYQFTTQLFKLGISAVAAVPKAIITCALIPPVMALMFKNKKKNEQEEAVKNREPQKTLTFTGKLPKEPLTKGISEIIDCQRVQRFSNKFKDSNYPMHISALTDILATGTFISQTKSSKKIPQERKNTLIYNSAISTGLSIFAGYVVDKLLDKPTEKFIRKFSEINKDAPKLDKYVEGIKIAKPVLILGSIYYCLIPLVSTFFAERADKVGTKVSK